MRDQLQEWGLSEVLHAFPALSIRPNRIFTLQLIGNLHFQADLEGKETITDKYQIDLRVPHQFPVEPPKVEERGDRIPSDYHTNPDGCLCLGSPLALRLEMKTNPTLPGFIWSILIPYLYQYSYYELHGSLPFTELPHGTKGVFQDYTRILQVNSSDQVLPLLALTGTKKREANKRLCPCGSGLRVGKCHNRIINPIREQLGRPWCRREHDCLQNDRYG